MNIDITKFLQPIKEYYFPNRIVKCDDEIMLLWETEDRTLYIDIGLQFNGKYSFYARSGKIKLFGDNIDIELGMREDLKAMIIKYSIRQMFKNYDARNNA